MGLLHKNLILAGIASVAMVGFLGSSSVSALDGFSFSDIIRDYRNRTEQLKSYLTNPFGSGCEATNPDSTISCNETSFPNLLFNGAPNNSAWGHDGKGVIFINNDNLVDGNPQLATARRGDTLNYSMEIETQRYNDAEMTGPVEAYAIFGLFSDGLVFDPQSIVVKVGEQVLSEESFVLEYNDDLGGEGAILGGAKSAFWIQIPWNNSGNFLYDEDAKITVSYSANVAQDAPSEVWSRGVHLSDTSSMDYSIFQSTDYQAIALIDGNILIRRVDANGNPLAGARYTIDGVKTSIKDETSNLYVFDSTGAISEVSTNSDGVVIISGLPMGKYTVREIYSPNGHPVESNTIEKEIVDGTTTIEYGEKWETYNPFGETDFTDYINNPISMDDGRILVPTSTSSLAAPDNIVYQYSEDKGNYYNSEMSSTITKNGDTYHLKEMGSNRSFEHDFIYDSSLGKLVSHRSWLDVFGERATSMYDYLEFDGAQARIVDGGSQYTLTYDDDGDLYSGTSSSGTLALKKDGNEYRLEKGYNSISYVLDPESGKYLKEFDIYVYVLESVTDSEIVVKPYYSMSYSPAFGHYYICLGFNDQTVVNDKRNQLRVSEFLFRDKTEENVMPEDINNPQTGDAALKAIAIAVFCLAPISILRKRLTRR